MWHPVFLSPATTMASTMKYRCSLQIFPSKLSILGVLTCLNMFKPGNTGVSFGCSHQAMPFPQVLRHFFCQPPLHRHRRKGRLRQDGGGRSGGALRQKPRPRVSSAGNRSRDARLLHFKDHVDPPGIHGNDVLGDVLGFGGVHGPEIAAFP